MALLEFNCAQCGRSALVRREPVYDGFSKTGERLFCSHCGVEVPGSVLDDGIVKRTAPTVFSDEDKLPALDIFSEAEKGHNCRHCRHYVVNPFYQRCALSLKEVVATDVCFEFQPGNEDKNEGQTG